MRKQKQGIVIKEEIRLPGTNIILEKGDTIMVEGLDTDKLKWKLDKGSWDKKNSFERRKMIFEWIKTGHINYYEFEFILDLLNKEV